MRKFVWLLFIFSAIAVKAEYVSTDIIEISELKEKDVVMGIRIYWEVNDTSYPKASNRAFVRAFIRGQVVELPKQSPLKGNTIIYGEDYTAIKDLAIDAQKDAIWQHVKPHIADLYKSLNTRPEKEEVIKKDSILKGELTREAPDK